MKATEIKLMRRSSGDNRFDKKTNSGLMKELNTQPVMDEITSCRAYWRKLFPRMVRARIPF